MVNVKIEPCVTCRAEVSVDKIHLLGSLLVWIVGPSFVNIKSILKHTDEQTLPMKNNKSLNVSQSLMGFSRKALECSLARCREDKIRCHFRMLVGNLLSVERSDSKVDSNVDCSGHVKERVVEFSIRIRLEEA